MAGGDELAARAEGAAREAVSEWIRGALREAFLQALRRVWTLRPVDDGSAAAAVEVSAPGFETCLGLVERVAGKWRDKLEAEGHHNAGGWVWEVFERGKQTLWEGSVGGEETSGETHAEPLSRGGYGDLRDDDDGSNDDGSNDDGSNDDGSNDEPAAPPGGPASDRCHHPGVYASLRSLGRKRRLDYSVLSVPDALGAVEGFARDHPTYWPAGHWGAVETASLELADRMEARDRHGSGHAARNGGGDGAVYTKKAVRFQVLPKTVWETKQRKQQQHQQQRQRQEHGQQQQENDGEGAGATAADRGGASLAARIVLAHRSQKAGRRRAGGGPRTEKGRQPHGVEDPPRPPSDATLPVPGGLLPVVLTPEEIRRLEGLLVNVGDGVGPKSTAAAPREDNENNTCLGLFGGLECVGQTTHAIKNRDTGVPSDNNAGVVFMDPKNTTDRARRRRERTSIQERLDPNRVRAGREENPWDRRSKVLRTEDWFDARKKFLDLDLGWCLLELPTPERGGRKRLCAFSSMEACLGDHD
ncbi:unnamed protein product [Pseudo-nitzschia multistriata]|uniref:Uncharacterized protein n=1 Tax=Pseudo-nitzschia multistriata TaxID=183589 RepID=A0A448YXP5_9STRA|nr:unnamed protein product [Pseudo-nitzschia multistriata]